jgi:hypothetical protein
MARAVWFVATASLTVAIFLRQAFCLGMHNPRRPIRWVCGAVLFSDSFAYIAHLPAKTSFRG